ncbi:hypothetical protein LTR56_021172 [Elasticomyces elasticus]|nr:hypothetical protein LTR56_021172 [Elasticomyces elasticus]KAK3631777.1 hypothetical protein LTR22_020915 [Elasticomyces elasticus]
MSKRQRDQQEDTSRPPKRPRPETNVYTPVIEDIQFANQLQKLLLFRQDGVQQLRNGIASFKAFLESILYHRDPESRPRQLSILREFLESQKPPEDVENGYTQKPFLGQLWQAWSFAAHQDQHNDYLSSQISAIFALLIKTLSSLLDFRDYGILLCRTVLQGQHLRLVKRGLEAPRFKDFVISPCLRLLTEITSFDGGALARDVYKKREQTFEIGTLRQLLGCVKKDVDEEEAKRKPSLRTLTVRYVLAHLKYLHEGGKTDLLKSRPLMIGLLHHLPEDPAELVNEILTITEQNVLKDSSLPRHPKAVLLTQHNLDRVTEVATRTNHASADRAFAWLKAVATNPSYGILLQSAWYPPNTATPPSTASDVDSAIDLGLDSLDFYDRPDQRSELRNTILHDWVLTLRPHTDPKERELVLACFESAPELVAPYFAEKQWMLEPKLSNTWLGYAGFFFEVIRLAVPSHLGHTEDDGMRFAELPPQANIVLESVLPSPLTQAVLARCLNEVGSELIRFFGVRILVLALQKLEVVLVEMRKAAQTVDESNKALWIEASERLLSRFAQRIPAMKDVVQAFKRVPDDDEHALQREGVTRLLRLYYEVSPGFALEEKVDVSAALTAALTRGEGAESLGEVKALRALYLEHLLVIAQHSRGMLWFAKGKGLKHSPMVSLLQLHVRDPQNERIRSLIGQVLAGHDLLAAKSDVGNEASELEALIASLVNVTAEDGETWAFVDDCMARGSRQPVKYVDQIDAATARYDGDENEDDSGLPGLLAAVVAEQSHFVAKRPKTMDLVNCFLNLLSKGAAPSKAAMAFYMDMLKLDPERAVQTLDTDVLLAKVRLQESAVVAAAGDHGRAETSLSFTPPSAEQDNHPELLRWAKKDLALAVEDDDIGSLILCLCSQHTDIRRQALAQLRNLFAKLQTSTLEDKGQISVLVGELIETFEQQYLEADKPLPYLTGTFAGRALSVLIEPTHIMYPKLNEFIMRRPEWRSSRLPSYWLSRTVFSEPTEDDAYWKEAQWVVEWLVDGLRTSADLEVLRRGDALAKVMALHSSPAANRTKGLKMGILELVYRATCVEGGSDALITRMGVLEWLAVVGGDMARLMRNRLLETCGRERIEKWSGLSVEQL